jgi:hypothetical protein
MCQKEGEDERGGHQLLKMKDIDLGSPITFGSTARPPGATVAGVPLTNRVTPSRVSSHIEVEAGAEADVEVEVDWILIILPCKLRPWRAKRREAIDVKAIADKASWTAFSNCIAILLFAFHSSSHAAYRTLLSRISRNALYSLLRLPPSPLYSLLRLPHNTLYSFPSSLKVRDDSERHIPTDSTLLFILAHSFAGHTTTTKPTNHDTDHDHDPPSAAAECAFSNPRLI